MIGLFDKTNFIEEGLLLPYQAIVRTPSGNPVRDKRASCKAVIFMENTDITTDPIKWHQWAAGTLEAV